MELLHRSLVTLIPLFTLIYLGNLLARGGALTPQINGAISRFVFVISAPALLLRSAARTSIEESLDITALAGLYIAAITTAAIFYVMARRVDRERRGVLAQGAFRGNLAFMGLPILLAYYSADDPVMGAAAILIGLGIPLYNLLGITLLTLPLPQATLGRGRLASIGERLKQPAIELSRNPLIIGTLIGLSLSWLNITIPATIDPTLEMLAATAVPLGLISIGAGINLRELRDNLPASIVASCGKLIVSPAIAAAVVIPLGAGKEMAIAAVVLAATPAAVVSAIMAREMRRDDKLASSILILSTLVGLPVVALWLMLLELWYGA